MNLIGNIRSSKRIVVYGAQAVACGIVSVLINIFEKIPEAILVSDSKGNPTEIFGVKVVELKDALAFKDCLVLIAVPVNLHNEIIDVLRNNGFINHIAIDNEMEYELMSLYYRKSGRFFLLSDIESTGEIPNVGVYMARSVFDKKVSGMNYFNKRSIVEIQAGAAVSEDKIAELTDMNGDNISKHNRLYCELTATYWVWKNVKADYKGICHYRRILDLTEEEYQKLKAVDAVLPLPFLIYPNASAQFLRFINDEEYSVLLSILKEIYPQYFVAAHKFWYEPYLYNYNMLIAKEAVFDSYCEFLFNVLLAIQDFFESNEIRQNDRYLGYLGEILTSLYFMVNNNKLRIAHAKKNMVNLEEVLQMQNKDMFQVGFTAMKRWLENRNEGKTFADYLSSFGYQSIGIYGAGEVGVLLYTELKGVLNVLYFIDKNAESYGYFDGIPVILPQDLSVNSKCDIIIVTVMSDFDSISSVLLSERPWQAIINIYDAVYEF